MGPVAVAYINTIHFCIHNVIFPPVRYPTFVPRTILSPMDIVAHLLGSVFTLTVLGTISPRVILDVSHLLAFILNCTVLKHQMAVRKKRTVGAHLLLSPTSLDRLELTVLSRCWYTRSKGFLKTGRGGDLTMERDRRYSAGSFTSSSVLSASVIRIGSSWKRQTRPRQLRSVH
ncbi:MAG: hypothetical protein Q9217_000740 [Psora testacea]